jgi:hypothetical protein
MGPGRLGGLGPSSAAVLATLLVVIAVWAMVSVGGGANRPLVAPAPHVALASTAPSQG